MPKRVVIFLSILLLLLCVSARAQRTSKGIRSVSASASWTVSSFGGELDYGTYLHNSYLFGGLNIANRAHYNTTISEIVNHQSLEALMGWEWRLYGTRSRVFNIYLGGDVFIGVEMFDLFKNERETTRKIYYNEGIKDYKFIFGLSPRVEIEYFVSTTVAITASARAPITFLSQYSKFNYLNLDVLLGVKINIL